MAETTSAFHVMSKPTGAICNLDGSGFRMGLDFFRRTLELEQQFRRPGQRVLNTLQTNGTLLDDEWAAFLRDELVTHRTVGAEHYGRFLVDVFEEWVRRDVGEVLVLEHNGDLYSCDHYVEDDYLLGNIAEGRTLLQLAMSPQQMTFGQAKTGSSPPRTVSPVCTTCAPATSGSSGKSTSRCA